MSPSNGFKGFGLLMTANVASCAMACLVKAGSGLNPYYTTLFRFAIGIGVIGLMAMFSKASLTFVNKKGLLWRGLAGGAAICLCFVSIMHIGVVKASVIVYTYPIFAILFGALFLRERVGVVKITAVIVTFIGIFSVITDSTTTGANGMWSFGVYELLAVASAILGGIAVVFVKKLQDTDSTVSIYFAQCLIGLWMMLVPAASSSTAVGIRGALFLVAIGLLAAVVQLVMTEGYKYVSVSTGALITMTTPILNIAAGALFFREPFGVRTITGSLLVLGACSTVAMLKGQQTENAETDSVKIAGAVAQGGAFGKAISNG